MRFPSRTRESPYFSVSTRPIVKHIFSDWTELIELRALAIVLLAHRLQLRACLRLRPRLRASRAPFPALLEATTAAGCAGAARGVRATRRRHPPRGARLCGDTRGGDGGVRQKLAGELGGEDSAEVRNSAGLLGGRFVTGLGRTEHRVQCDTAGESMVVHPYRQPYRKRIFGRCGISITASDQRR